jgi:hypothetical protein
MLARLILLLVQLAVGWFAAPYIAAYIPRFGALDIYVYAIIFALLVTIVGFIGSLILQGVGTPSTGTLTFALLFAIVFAALTMLQPVTSLVADFVPGLPLRAYPLIGAVLGYLLKR